MTPANYWKQVREACAAKSKGVWWLSEQDGSIQSDNGHVSDNDMSDGDEAFVVIASEALPLALARIEELETALSGIIEESNTRPQLAGLPMFNKARAALGET